MNDRLGRPLGWLRLAFRLATSRLGLLTASMLTALVAATLLVTASVLSPAVAEQTFRGTVAAEPAAAHDLRATTAFNDTWPEVDRDLRDVTRQHDEIVSEVTTAAWTIATADQYRLAFGTVQNLDTHAELSDGRWPDSGATPIEAVVHAGALDTLGIDIGDRLTVELLAGPSVTVDALVVGAFEPSEREHVLWRGLGHGALVDDQEDAPTVFGPLLVPTDDLVDRVQPGSTTAVWTVRLDLNRVSVETADAAIRSLALLRDDLADVATGDQSTRVSIAGGTDVLERARDAASSARAVLFVIVTMVAVLAAWALAFTARILAAGRASVTALFRARGGRDRLLVRLSVLSAAVPALVVAGAAPPVADLILAELRNRDVVAATGSTGRWLLSTAVAAGWLTMLVVADLRSGRSMASVSAESARPTRRAAVQRAGVDVVVLALALLALQQLHRPVGATPDVVLIVAPAVLVLAGTLIVVRLLPWCSRAAALVAARTRGLPAVLGSFEVARRPLRHVAAVAMLALALAAAVFAATTQATWNSFRDNSVALAEPADVRVSMVPVLVTDRPVEAAADQLAALPEVEAVMPVHHESARSDTRQIDLIGVDPGAAVEIMRWPPALAGGPAPQLLAALTGPGDLPALVTRTYADELGLDVDSTTIVTVRGVRLQVRVAGLVNAVPGATQPYAMLVDQQALRHALREWVEVIQEGADTPELVDVDPAPNQWWLATSDNGASAAAGAATLGGVTSVSTHADAAESSSLEVTARGVFAGLTGGLAFAAAFGIVGTILHAVASYRSRTGEHAVLRAVGLGRSSTLSSIATEQTLLIGFATVAGLGLGTVVSWLTVPHTIGRLAGLPELPRLELTVPWQVLAALGVSAAILLGVIVAVAAASLRTVSITSVLRAGEEA